MIFRQLFEPESSTYTYLLHCQETGQTALIDPVIETVERDLQLLQSLGLHLDYAIETHLHADHITRGCPDNLPPEKIRLCEAHRQG